MALGTWSLLIAAGWLWGTLLNQTGAEIRLDAPPLHGVWDLRLNAALLAPVAVAGAVVALAPLAVARLGWRSLLLATALVGLGWSVALAMVDGVSELESALRAGTQYIHTVPAVDSAFLPTFVERIDGYPTHVRAHPPAMVLALWALAELGLGGSWAAVAVILALAATAAPAVLITVRELAGEAAARRVAPFLALTPAALSIATTADALYMAVGAWAVCALVLAIVRSSAGLAVVGGLLFGVVIFCSYGLVLLGAVPLAVALDRRRARQLVVATGAVLTIVAAFALAGFWWLDGFFATRREYLQSVAKTRPYEYFVLNNLSATAVSLGPAVAVGLVRLRDRRIWLLAGGALAAVALANLSGMSKAEVERIWLPFLPWIFAAAAAVAPSRGLLGAQVALTLAVVVSVNSRW